MAEVADAWVSLKPSAKGFGSSTVSQVGGEMDGAGKTLGSRLGTAMRRGAIAVLAGGVLAAGFLKGAVEQASDLNETVSKTAVVFGKALPQVRNFANQGATALGQTKQQVLDAASSFGIFGKVAGLQGRPLAKFSTDLTSLSTDLASFYNTDPEQAVGAIGAALRGESEPIRAFGVLLDDATLKAEALRLGLLKPVKDKAKILAAQVAVTEAQQGYNDALAEHGKGSLEALKAQASLGTKQGTLRKAVEGTVPALSAQNRVMAAQSVIMKQTKVAQGDFQRTSGGLANQQRILSASFNDVKTRLGSIFLPIVLRVTKFLNTSVVPAVGKFVKQMSNGKGEGGKFADSLRPVGDFFKSIDWGAIGTALLTLDFSKLTGAFTGVDWAGIGKIIASIDFAGIINALTGTGIKTVKLFGIALGFISKHAEVIAKWLPVLIGAFIAYKTVVALAEIITLAHIPAQIAMSGALLASASANRALAKATTQATAGTTAQTGATTASGLAAVRQAVATVASTVAQKVAAAASKAWAAAQWLLNAALAANPIGLIIIAVIALVAALILAWKKSDTFRAIVTKAFDKIKAVAGKVLNWLVAKIGAVVGWVKNHWRLLIAIFGGPLGIIVGLVTKHWTKIRDFIVAAITKIGGWLRKLGQWFIDRIQAVAKFYTGVAKWIGKAIGKVLEIRSKIIDGLADFGTLLVDKGRELIQGLIDGITDKIDDVKGAMGKVGSAIGKFMPGSPVREGPLKKWNRGAAGKRLVGLLAQGLNDTGPVDRAAGRLASRVQVPQVQAADVAGSSAELAAAAAARGGVQIHVDKLMPHDYRAFMGDMQRRSQRAALGGYT